VHFEADPHLTPGAVAMVAQRREAGEAFHWKPGGDVGALLAFVGDKFVAVGDLVYERLNDGFLRPLNMSNECVWFKPLAGDGIVELTLASFVSLFATIEDDRPDYDTLVATTRPKKGK
jgi:hypothetical protein